MSIEKIRNESKLFIDANVWDGEDRAGCTGDQCYFDPDELQTLIDDMLDDILKDYFSEKANKKHFKKTRSQAVDDAHQLMVNSYGYGY